VPDGLEKPARQMFSNRSAMSGYRDGFNHLTDCSLCWEQASVLRLLLHVRFVGLA
jgi:hypothetical protein